MNRRSQDPQRANLARGGAITGVIVRPRATFAALVETPAWLATWVALLLLWGASGAWLLSTAVGQQALVDEQVRVTETFGGAVSDAEYAALQASPPWWVYLTSGGRVLLLPVTTLAVAALLYVAARGSGRPATMRQTLAVAVHASVPLVIGQLVATPLHYVRESLTSPLNLAAILPAMQEGTLPARFFGTMDVFALWWAGLLSIGLAALTGRRARSYAWRFAALFLVFGAVTAAIIAVMGGA